MRRLQLISVCGLLIFKMASGQTTIPLYDDAVPNSKTSSVEETSTTDAKGITRVSGVTVPTLTAYFPKTGSVNTGKAVIICPGGGYRILAITHEGHDIAKLLAEQGVTAFVLKYRLPSDEIMVDKRIGPLQDAQRAMQLVRERADR